VKYSSLSRRPGPVAGAGLGEREDQVDVRGEIELAAAELAHADHDQRLRLLPRPARRAVTGAQRVSAAASAAADAGLGQRGEVGERALHAVDARDVAHDQPQRLAPPVAPELGRGLVRGLERRQRLDARRRVRKPGRDPLEQAGSATSSSSAKSLASNTRSSTAACAAPGNATPASAAACARRDRQAARNPPRALDMSRLKQAAARSGSVPTVAPS
jgi:hypothetical protein